MAKIPMGNFGTMIAASAPRPNIPAGAYKNSDGGIQAGNALINLAGNVLHEDQKRQEELDRSRALVAVSSHQSAVQDALDGMKEKLATGELSRDKAPNEFSNAMAKVRDQSISGVPEWLKENAGVRINATEQRAMLGLNHLMEGQRRQELAGNLEIIRDSMAKDAGRPGADVGKLNSEFEQAANALGSQAGFGADKLGKMVQDFKDRNWDAQLNQQAMATRNDIAGINALQKQITEGEYADKLDSNRRNTLVAKLDGYKTSLIQRNEAAAARAARQQEAALKRAEAEFNTFQGIADKGAIISPEYVDRAIAATKGTPYQAGIVALSKQAQETGGLAFQPISVQQAAIDEIDRAISTNGRTPELDRRREQLLKIRNGSLSDVKNEGIRAWTARSYDVISPINISSPDALAGSISERVKLAERASSWAGKLVSPLDSSEADQLRGVLEVLPARQRAQAIATISQAVGPRYAAAISQQLDDKDRPLALAFATSSSQTSTGRYTSELIIKGATSIKDGAVMKDDKKVTGWKATIAKELDGLFPNEVAAQAAKDSAYYIAAGLAAENGGSVSGDDIQRSVRLAIDGSIIERNGKRLPVPAGWSSSDLENGLRNVPTSAVIKQAPGGKVRVGGAEMSADEFITSLPGQELMYAGQGRYAVIVKGRPVTNAEGRPIIIGVK